MFGFSLSPKEVSVKEAFEKIGADGHILLDVRTPGEVREVCVAGSKNISLELLENALEDLRGYTSIHVLCRSGSRSAYATQILHSNGITQAKNVAGGMIAWQQESLPTTRG
ncbi:hypothetical protein MNBD_CPR01-570 [hydrothermal vent metagenome]|uniref:Rhodanese domain-containing protein n=1 Tax=hydrothermal vent metagenome TaxID=652676 RepID=A0A3B0VME6_9ZZZZ